MWLCICFPVWRSLIPYTFCFGRKESQGERWRDYFFVKIWGMDIIWLTCHGACGLIAIQDGKCLRGVMEELWECRQLFGVYPERWRTGRGRGASAIPSRFVKTWYHCMSSLSQKTSPRNPSPAVYLILGYPVCRRDENQSIECKFNKSRKYLEDWHTEILNWIEEERLRNQTVEEQAWYQCSLVCNVLSL